MIIFVVSSLLTEKLQKNENLFSVFHKCIIAHNHAYKTQAYLVCLLYSFCWCQKRTSRLGQTKDCLVLYLFFHSDCMWSLREWQ